MVLSSNCIFVPFHVPSDVPESATHYKLLPMTILNEKMPVITRDLTNDAQTLTAREAGSRRVTEESPDPRAEINPCDLARFEFV